MEIVRDIVIVLHLISFALLFGAWLVEAIARRVRITRAMHWGLAAALVTGLALAAPWGLGDGELNYAFWCFVRCGMTPGEYAALPEREKLVVQAMIEVWLEREKE